MSFHTLLYVVPAVWDAIAPSDEDPPQPWHYAYRNSPKGQYFTDFLVAYKVYPVLSESAVALKERLEEESAGSVARAFSWIQGQGWDSLDVNPTDPDDILAVMKPHVEYDENGEVIGSTPATFLAPNWGVVYSGMNPETMIFAGGFSAGFSGGFK